MGGRRCRRIWVNGHGCAVVIGAESWKLKAEAEANGGAVTDGDQSSSLTVLQGNSITALSESMAADDRPWLIDGRSGAVTTYGQLLAGLNARPARVRRLSQPASTREALLEVTAAIAHEVGLTLFDRDFGVQEVTNLGYSPAELNQEAVLESAVQLDATRLAELAAGASRGRLGLFTSGSTGLPKLVWQSFPNLARAVKVSPRHGEAVWALAYNPTHVAAIQVYLQALANSCAVVDVYGLDRAGVLGALERHGVTHVSATPSFYRLLLPCDRALPGVRSVTLGGERSDAALLGRLAELFPNARFHNVYASTEAGTLLVADGDVFAIAEGLAGKVRLHDGRIFVHRSLLGEFGVAASPPVTGYKLMDDGGEVSPQDGVTSVNRDRLMVNSPNTHPPITTNQSPLTNLQSPLTAAADAAAWYDTGDVVEVVSEVPLRFRIVARERDWVNVGGSKVNPHEVEAALCAHPAVKQARVFGRKNSVLGSILAAEVVAAQPPPVNRDPLMDGSTPNQSPITNNPTPITNNQPALTAQQLCEAQLRAWLGERLQAHKIPRLIRFVDSIEQTRTGKISRL